MIGENSLVRELLHNPVSWLKNFGPNDDIAISSRIRIARNLADIPFPLAANEAQRQQVVDQFGEALHHTDDFANAIFVKMAPLDEHAKQLLLERRLVSTAFLADDLGTALAVEHNEHLCAMLNEEDHLRLQSVLPGLNLRGCSDLIFPVERALDRALNFAFLDPFGYLTACPTNVGTGMRVSVMLHLPALVMTEQINAIVRSTTPLGLSIRGMMGEGSENIGSLFQISNQSTLGDSEPQIIERIENIIQQIIQHEKTVRERLKAERIHHLKNHVGRAFGVLRYAHVLSAKEALTALSALRLGYDLGFLPEHVTSHLLNELFLGVQPAHLQWIAQRDLNLEERDVFRAEYVRQKLLPPPSPPLF